MNYGKDSVRNLLQSGRSTPQKISNRMLLHVLKILFLGLVLALTVAVGFAVGTVRGIIDTSPEPEALAVTPLGIASGIYDSNGNLMEQVNSEFREMVGNKGRIGIDNIPHQEFRSHADDFCAHTRSFPFRLYYGSASSFLFLTR